MSASSSNEPKARPEDRLTLLRTIQERLTGATKGPELRMPRWISVCLAVVFAAGFIVWSHLTAASPVPRGKQNREEAAAFLKQHHPDRALHPSAEKSVTAPVAALFYVIQNGNPDEATQAVRFAAEQDYGNASPYVMERLENSDPRLREAARDFLRKMAGRDYGPDQAAWRAWWSDPPVALFGGVTIGRRTLQTAVPIAGLAIGAVLFIAGWSFRKDALSVYGAGMMVVGWFLSIGALGLRFVGHPETCTFGGAEIAYYQGGGVVHGLQDARAGGMGLWSLLCLAYVGIPFGLMVFVVVIHSFLSNRKSTAPSDKTS